MYVECMTCRRPLLRLLRLLRYRVPTAAPAVGAEPDATLELSRVGSRHRERA